MPHKIYVGAANGAHKIVPKDQSLFSKVSKSVTDDKIDMTAALNFGNYGLLCLNCLSFLRLFLCSYSSLT